jgi:hypothetical protein
VLVPEPVPVPVPEPLALEPVPGIVLVPEPVEPEPVLEPMPLPLAVEPEPVLEPMVPELDPVPEPMPVPLAVEPVPGMVLLPELELDPPTVPEPELEGVELLVLGPAPGVLAPEATPGQLFEPGTVAPPDGGVVCCCAPATTAIVTNAQVKAEVTSRFMYTLLHATRGCFHGR